MPRLRGLVRRSSANTSTPTRASRASRTVGWRTSPREGEYGGRGDGRSDRGDWLSLATSTPIVWYAGWISIGGARTSLRNRALNMAVLVATGVLAAWLASVFLTIVGEETFFRGGGDAHRPPVKRLV